MSGIFSSPRGSPARSAKLSSDDSRHGDSPKNRSKTSFSSPFNIRKKKSKDLSNESPTTSLSSLQTDSGVFVSPSASRHGSFTLTRDAVTARHSARQSPVLTTPLLEGSRAFATVHEQQETVALVHHPPLRQHSSSPRSCDTASPGCLVTFQSHRQQTNRSSSDHVIHDQNKMAATGVCLAHKVRSQCSKQRSSSYDRCAHLQSNSCSSLNRSDNNMLVHKPVLTQKNSISPKRRNSPTDCCHGDVAQSSKRQHHPPPKHT